MEKFDSLNLLYYCLFATFVYYQQLHLRDFRGSSKMFELVLTIFSFAGMIVGFGYLIYYGYRVSWWTPFVVLAASLVFMFFAGIIAKFMGKLTMSLLGFAVWPVSAYFMFTTIPSLPS